MREPGEIGLTATYVRFERLTATRVELNGRPPPAWYWTADRRLRVIGRLTDTGVLLNALGRYANVGQDGSGRPISMAHEYGNQPSVQGSAAQQQQQRQQQQQDVLAQGQAEGGAAGFRFATQAVQFRPNAGQFDSTPLVCTCAPRGCIARVDALAKSSEIPT